MPLPLTLSCFSKMQIGFTFLVLAHLGSPGKRAVKRVCVYFSDLYWVCVSVFLSTVLFVSISQVIGCEDRLWNDLDCVGWGVKLYSNYKCHIICCRHDSYRKVHLLRCKSILTWCLSDVYYWLHGKGEIVQRRMGCMARGGARNLWLGGSKIQGSVVLSNTLPTPSSVETHHIYAICTGASGRRWGGGPEPPARMAPPLCMACIVNDGWMGWSRVGLEPVERVSVLLLFIVLGLSKRVYKRLPVMRVTCFAVTRIL